MRVWLGPEKFWLQFVPPALGATWLLIYFWRRHHLWLWREQLPLLSAVSVATAAYGWTFDQAVMLLAIVHVAVRIFEDRSVLTWSPSLIAILTAYLALNVLATSNFPWEWFWWQASCFLGWYLVVRKYLGINEARKDVLISSSRLTL
jgi:hypothetical protein